MNVIRRILNRSDAFNDGLHFVDESCEAARSGLKKVRIPIN